MINIDLLLCYTGKNAALNILLWFASLFLSRLLTRLTLDLGVFISDNLDQWLWTFCHQVMDHSCEPKFHHVDTLVICLK